jgi:peptide/nickel transport system permease protein
MGTYILRRLFLLVPTLFVVSLMVFSLVRTLPGDVVERKLTESPSYSQQTVDSLRERLGLDKPFIVQYVTWLEGLIQLNLGESLYSGRSVAGEIAKRLPVTIQLALMSFLVSNAIAIPLGIMSATRQDSVLDYAMRVGSFLGQSVPQFWLATLVILFGARWFGYLPPLEFTPITRDLFGNVQQLLIPSLIVALASSAAIMRLIRSSMLEVLRQDYMRTARAKGLSERRTIYTHGLRNALLPIITYQALQLNFLLTGSLVIEIIFNLPGIGQLTLSAINERDYTTIQGIALVFGMVFALSNVIVDILYAYVDPRIRY